MSSPAAIVQALREIARFLQIKGESAYRVRAFELAGVSAEAHADELPRRLADGTLQELDYIGPTTERVIRELWETDRSTYLNELRGEIPEGVVHLAALPGIGPRRAMTLFQTLHVTSPEELIAASRAGRVRALHGFGEKTETRLLEAALRALPGRPQTRLPTGHQLALPLSGDVQPPH